MESNRNLSRNIKTLRKEMEKNLEEFALDSGVGRSTVQDIECGKANITLDTLDTMAEHLGVSPLHLVGGTCGPLQKAHEILGTLKQFCELPSDKREQAVGYFCSLVALLGGGEL